MIETTRERILANLKSELMNIQIVNGYSLDLAEVRVGLFNNTSITNYPTCIIQFGDDNLVTQTEGLILGENQIDLGVIVYLNTNTENLAEETEKVIKDLQKFFSRDESISREYTSSLSDLEYIMNYRILTISPYISGTNNSTACGLVLRINYFNKIESTPLPIPDLPMLEIPTNNYDSGVVKQPFVWNVAENAVNYQLQVSDDKFETFVINQDKILTPSYTTPHDISLVDGTTYQWRVRAQGANDVSGWSDEWSFTVNDYTPIIIPDYRTGLVLEWDADYKATSANGLLSSIEDKISALVASQSTTGLRPKLLTNYKNGHNAIFFDANTQKMSFPLQTFSNYTIYITCNPTQATTGDGNVLLGGSAGDVYTSLKLVNAGMGVGNASVLRDSTLASDAGTGWAIRTYQAQKLYKNGVERAYQNTANPATINMNVIGGRNLSNVFPWYGEVTNIRVYNEVHNQTIVNIVTEYLNSLYTVY